MISVGSCERSSEHEGSNVSTVVNSSEDDANMTNLNFVREFEESIELPSGARNLEAYDRYYHIGSENFEGIFTLASEPRGTIFFVTDVGQLPRMLDGGCLVVNVRGSIRVPHLASVFCNGVA